MSELNNGPGRRPGLHLGPEVVDAFSKAAREFKAILSVKDREEFESSRRELIRGELNIMQTQQQETKSLVNLKRLQMFLDGMTALQEILGEWGLREVNSIMACIWGPMRFLFKTTRLDDKAFDNILDVYQRLGIQIPPLTEYKDLFKAFPDSITCLVHIYKDILEFHAIAYKLFSRRQSFWQKLHRATWKDLNSTFDHLAATLKLHFDSIQDHGRPFRDRHAFRTDSGFDSGSAELTYEDKRKFDEYRINYRQKWKDFRQSEANRKAAQKSKIIKWIAASSETELHSKFRGIREICPENGTWLWRKHDEVSNWMREDPPAESNLWIHGRRGLGKTVLSSLVVDELGKLATKGTDVPRQTQICYFYCQKDDNELETYLGILRGILHQLVSAAELPDPENESLGNESGNHNLAILPLCEDKITSTGGSTLNNQDVAEGLIEVFFEASTRQYVVIDGLDECKASTEIQQTVTFFTKQVTKCEDLCQGQLRVLFMSQTSKEIGKLMSKHNIQTNAGEIELDPNDNMEDIRRYVRTLLIRDGTKFSLSEWDKQYIEDNISGRSEGLFLYAHLAMDYLLKQISKDDLLAKAKLGKLPNGLKEMYCKLLEAVKQRLLDLEEDGSYWNSAKQLLSWLICAHRTLKWHEIQAILSFDLKTEIIDFNLKMIRVEVNEFLGSLVQVLPGDNIRLIHNSAKEYLAETEDIDAKSVQCDLAIRCLRYLSLRCFVASDYNEAERQDHIIQGYFSFQDYAMAQWYKHINTVIEESRPVLTGGQQATENSPALTAALTFAIQKFVTAHDDLKPAPASTADLPQSKIDSFNDLPDLYHPLLRLWNHICQHQKDTSDKRNKVGIARLENALKAHRDAIEKDFKPSRPTLNADTIEHYYGPNLFKCSRTLCKFFHHGFDNKKDRDSHQNRHDRPYPCPLEERCGFAPVGFSSNKDRQRHVRNYHPQLSDAPSAFLHMRRRVEAAKFQCTICHKSFTRNVNLKGHERSHFGERPYACSRCGKAFARVNDCRRHERIHTRNGQ
ncbi:hypothetical protein CkaCkLH20_04591 [Colletotrichum karsti]|uniref:C2H2-type domain-containing protein n=1 Tax=Colletotrichum karsti TaxID=1095194 RepID=A0A9P6I8Q3_9PEZI|nr:uncharacterized protein CkaCkLH20_04591 [Colletotrichum karsti]KAF9878015.1 hypothetical protein CkaCkLH20_04591 [Colletotrichum karsti]